MAYYFTTKLRKELGRNIKKLREDRKLTQIEISVDAGLNPSYYSKIERGEVNPSMEKLYRIIKALKANSSDILPF
jgi:transcriptional regulator with XRE-family HTH domain